MYLRQQLPRSGHAHVSSLLMLCVKKQHAKKCTDNEDHIEEFVEEGKLQIASQHISDDLPVMCWEVFAQKQNRRDQVKSHELGKNQNKR